MDGWMNEWMDGWMNEWMDRLPNGLTTCPYMVFISLPSFIDHILIVRSAPPEAHIPSSSFTLTQSTL